MTEDETYYTIGSTMICRYCGTVYDTWAVDNDDYVPPVGDGCEYCESDLWEDD